MSNFITTRKNDGFTVTHDRKRGTLNHPKNSENITVIICKDTNRKLLIKDMFFTVDKNSLIKCGYYSELVIVGYFGKQTTLHEFHLSTYSRTITDRDCIFNSIKLSDDQYNDFMKLVLNTPITRHRHDDEYNVTVEQILEDHKNHVNI